MSYVFDAPTPVAVPVANSDKKVAVRRVYCVGRNYAEHAREMGFDPDREPPFFFCKPTDAVVPVAEGEVYAFPYPPKTENLHYEAELVAVIGKGGADISVEKALEHVWGYAVGLDMTRRDLQLEMRKMGRPWEVGKAFDHSAPMGPIYPAEQIGHFTQGSIWLTVDGKERQRSDINKLIWSVAEVVSYLSSLFRLEPGDLILTGTPEGVGPVERGQQMRVGIEGLADLVVDVV